MWGCNGIYERYSATAPADVALVSPQTPLTPLYNPLLSGGYSKPYPWKAPFLASLQWVFCVFTCNHPPQQTLHPVAPRHPSSQAFREEGPFNRYIRRLRSDTKPDHTEIKPIYTCFSFVLRYILWYASLPLPTKLCRWDFESRRHSDQCKAVKASVPSL